MDLEEIIAGYNDLREKCLEIAKRNNGALMGSDAWLRFAITESDITLGFTSIGIECYGSAYTSQTMDNESFSFIIPLHELD
jgi:hypothetical protein